MATATPTLYVIATPIGDPDDITLRALRLLRETSVIATVDPDGLRALLRAYDLPDKRLLTLDDTAALLDALAQTGRAALAASSGTPGLDQPGGALIQAAIARGVRIEPIPGASAWTPALIAAGFPTDQFVFIGTLTGTDAPQQIAPYRSERATLLAYVEARTLLPVLTALCDVFGAAHPASAAVGISTPDETWRRDSLGALRTHFQAQPTAAPVTLALAGVQAVAGAWDETRVRAALEGRLRAGESLSQAARAVAAESGWRKAEVYALGRD